MIFSAVGPETLRPEPFSGSISASGSTGQATGNTLTDFRSAPAADHCDRVSKHRQLFHRLNDRAVIPFVIAPGTTGDWFAIEPQSVRVRSFTEHWSFHANVHFNGQVFGTLRHQQHRTKLVSPNLTDTVGSLTSSTWQDFGFDFLLNGLDPSAAKLPRSLYPNPTSNLLTVTIDGPSVSGNLVVRDMQGREMLRRRIEESGKKKNGDQHRRLEHGQLLADRGNPGRSRLSSIPPAVSYSSNYPPL